jgi:hypothetical protein
MSEKISIYILSDYRKQINFLSNYNEIVPLCSIKSKTSTSNLTDGYLISAIFGGEFI